MSLEKNCLLSAVFASLWLATTALAAGNLTGSFTGSWNGAGGGGAFNLTLRDADGKPEAQVSFGYGGGEVKTKVTHLAIDGDTIVCKYQFDLGGAKLESAIDGKLAGDTLSGKYTTTTVEGAEPVDRGEWKAERKK